MSNIFRVSNSLDATLILRWSIVKASSFVRRISSAEYEYQLETIAMLNCWSASIKTGTLASFLRDIVLSVLTLNFKKCA